MNAVRMTRYIVYSEWKHGSRETAALSKYLSLSIPIWLRFYTREDLAVVVIIKLKAIGSNLPHAKPPHHAFGSRPHVFDNTHEPYLGIDITLGTLPSTQRSRAPSPFYSNVLSLVSIQFASITEHSPLLLRLQVNHFVVYLSMLPLFYHLN